MSLTTKLEAINTMLSVLGEAPRNSLTTGTDPDVELALRILEEVTRETLSHGWHFNTTPTYTLSPDVLGNIAIPGTILRLDGDRLSDVVQRGDQLYNRADGTYTFDDDVEVSVIEYLEWTQLPEFARSYIMIRAARKFADRAQTDPALSRFSARDEAQAKATLDNAEAENGDYTGYGSEHYQFKRNRPYLN